MNNSQISQNISRKTPVQIPLKGFRVEVPSEREGWRVFHEGMGEGRIRVHMVKILK